MNKKLNLSRAPGPLRQTLSPLRAGEPGPSDRGTTRTAFESDVDRLTFDKQLRLLADKTQVHRFNNETATRSRLSHSMEVSRVGRSLGRAFVWYSRELHSDAQLLFDVQDILTAGGLLHDLGITPFGHNGEHVISHFFMNMPVGQKIIRHLSDAEKQEFTRYDSNSQSIRYAMELGGWSPDAGLRLTAATIATAVKYPWAGHKNSAKRSIFTSSIASYAETAKACNLKQIDHGTWQRHPLSYLCEAADDITYEIVDIEDAALLGILSEKEAAQILLPVLNTEGRAKYQHLNNIHWQRRISYLRSQAISNLVTEVGVTSRKYRRQIMSGTLPNRLSQLIPSAGALKDISTLSHNRIYRVATSASEDINTAALIEALETLASEMPVPKTRDQSLFAAHQICDAITGLTDTACSRFNEPISPRKIKQFAS
jgi:dGTPase